jgi:membrane-associated phospholipid phosphatase
MLFMAIVLVLAGARVPHGGLLAAGNLLAVGLTGLFRALQLRARGRALQCLWGAFPLALFCWLWTEIGPMQHLLHPGWFDPVLIRAEHAVLGVDLNLWLERYTRPWLTELMMLGYFAYVPLLPIVMVVLCAGGKREAEEEYLLGLAMAYAACCVAFILFPVAGPKWGFEGQFGHGLDGYVFRWLTLQIETYAHFPGGSFPSPHCAAGTVMLCMAYRHSRAAFWAILPFILTFYAATVYGRYHYVSDTVTGIALGAAVAWLTPRLAAWWGRTGGLRARTTAPGGGQAAAGA